MEVAKAPDKKKDGTVPSSKATGDHGKKARGQNS